jgi:asparagine synthase (glutamine-hydrolysing)
LADAVAARTIADVPLGAFLSGGIDSSIVVGHLAEASNHAVKTFCIGYADQPQYDESAYARQVADHFGTEHHEFKLTFDEVLSELDPLLDHLGEPFADASLLPTSVVSRETRSTVTVALSGDGGDELFAGYWRYRGHAWMDRYQKMPRWLRRNVIGPLVGLLPASKGSPWLNRARQARKLLRGDFDEPIGRHLAWASILAPEARAIVAAKFANDLLDEKWTRRSYEEAASTGRPQHWLNTLLRGDLGLLLPGDMLHKVDLASMRWSLEVRLPMLDHAFVEYVSGLPAEFKLHEGHAKRVLVDAHRDMLPEAALNRPKMGFELPIGEFLRGPLRERFQDTADDATLEAVGCFDPPAVRGLYEQHCRRRGEHADILYAVLVLCHWWRRMQPRPTSG